MTPDKGTPFSLTTMPENLFFLHYEQQIKIATIINKCLF